jgi:aromatic-L-amino-acid decarboxylase
MPSTTRVNGMLALRPCYVGARADQQQVDGLLESVLRIGKALEAGEP